MLVSAVQQPDPYPDIKGEVEREIAEATKLQADLFAGKRAAAEQLKYQFNNVTEQLHALETAVKLMVDSPERFQLDRTTAYTRQVEVETLRWQLKDLQATCAEVETSTSGNNQRQKNVTFSEVELHKLPNGDIHQQHMKSNGSSNPAPLRHSKLIQQHNKRHIDTGSAVTTSSRPPDAPPTAAGSNPSSSSSSKPTLPVSTLGSSGAAAAAYDDTRSGWDTGDWDSYEDAVQQQFAEQDHALDHISIHVDRIKQTGQAMHDELEEQTLLLGGLESDTDASHIRLRGLRKKVSDVLKRSRTDRQLCLILSLSVVLVIVTLIAMA